jgi:hypothetical protein
MRSQKLSKNFTQLENKGFNIQKIRINDFVAIVIGFKTCKISTSSWLNSLPFVHFLHIYNTV